MLRPHRGREVWCSRGRVEAAHAAVLALLADGEAWSSSAWRWRSMLTRAGCSGRSMRSPPAGKVQVVRPRTRAPLGDRAAAGFPDNLVTLGVPCRTSRICSSKKSAAEILREYGPVPGASSRAWRDFRRPSCLVRLGRLASLARSRERQDGARDRSARTCRNGVRWKASVPARREPHPEDRSGRPARCSPQSRRPGTAAIQAWPGRKERSGSESIARARSIRSIP